MSAQRRRLYSIRYARHSSLANEINSCNGSHAQIQRTTCASKAVVQMTYHSTVNPNAEKKIVFMASLIRKPSASLPPDSLSSHPKRNWHSNHQPPSHVSTGRHTPKSVNTRSIMGDGRHGSTAPCCSPGRHTLKSVDTRDTQKSGRPRTDLVVTS